MARPLDDDEKALWGKVITSVQPLHVVKAKPTEILTKTLRAEPSRDTDSSRVSAGVSRLGSTRTDTVAAAPSRPGNLDGSWDRRISKGAIIPDVSVDLHGTGLSGAYNRLDGALEQAIAQKMRVILLVTGKLRSHDRHSGEGRGAIASVVRDWLAASRHAPSISAVRNAHPRHGGSGALYIVLKR